MLVVPPRPTTWSAPVCVYRFFDHSGALLYVGITGSPEIRFGAHRTRSEWWSRVNLGRTLIYWRESQGHAEAEEVAAIIVERPIFNIAYRPGPRVVNRQFPVTGMGITDFRKQLSERVDAAYGQGEPTVVKHGSRNIARAVLVPYEWFERAQAALGEKG